MQTASAGGPAVNIFLSAHYKAITLSFKDGFLIQVAIVLATEIHDSDNTFSQGFHLMSTAIIHRHLGIIVVVPLFSAYQTWCFMQVRLNLQRG